MKVINIEDTEKGKVVTVQRRIFLFFKMISTYIKKNGEYYSDYGETFGIQKLKNTELSEKLDDEVDVFSNFYCK